MVENPRQHGGKDFRAPSETFLDEPLLGTNIWLERLLLRLPQQRTDFGDIPQQVRYHGKLERRVGLFAEVYLQYISRRLAEGEPWKREQPHLYKNIILIAGHL